MELTHDFTVPATIEQTWDALNDIEGVAGCFPGASVTSVEGDTFAGSCKVKLGPVSLLYNGSGTFTSKDESARTMRLEAKGKDKRGNGTAGADVSARMEETSEGTRVVVTTELDVTGKPAQFGRGMMQDVSDKLLAQFVECLAEKVGAAQGETTAGAAQGETTAGATPGDAAAAATGPAATAPGATPAEQDGPTSPADGAAPAGAGSGARAGAGGPGVAGGAPGPTGLADAAATGGATPRGSAEELDLGATVLPVLVRSYGKQVAGVLLALLLLGWLVRRRR